jgi:hypothetical protein
MRHTYMDTSCWRLTFTDQVVNIEPEESGCALLSCASVLERAEPGSRSEMNTTDTYVSCVKTHLFIDQVVVPVERFFARR